MISFVVVFCSSDGSKNEVSHPAVKVMGYPTIYLFPAADKQNPIEYDGERTADAIIDFVNNFRSIGGALWNKESSKGGQIIINSTNSEPAKINDDNTLDNKVEL